MCVRERKSELQFVYFACIIITPGVAFMSYRMGIGGGEGSDWTASAAEEVCWRQPFSSVFECEFAVALNIQHSLV